MKRPIPIMSLDNTYTFGGAINSLSHFYRAIDKKIFTPVVVSGQSMEILNDKFPDCICYHLISNLPWKNNRTYLKLTNMYFFRVRLLRKSLVLARFCYRMLFISLPEAFKYFLIGRRHKVALLHFNNGFVNLSWIIASKLLRVPSISHTRGFDEIKLFNSILARFVDHHVAISGSIRENLLRLGVPENRISLVYDAIDMNDFNIDHVNYAQLLQEFNLAPEQPRYGIFGRVADWKGIREFVLAAAEVRQKIPEAKGFVVGDVSDCDEKFLNEMQKLCSKLGLENTIVFTGYHKDVPAMMALMDVIVHASTQPEPFGMVIIEGMAMGKPIVATRAGGPLDIVEDEQTGYLVEMGDTVSLGKAVTTLLQNPALCSAMGKKGKARAAKLFNNKLHAAKMEKIFLQLHSQARV